MINFTTRREAFEAGTLRTVGESRSQEFASELRADMAERDGKTFVVLDGYASTVNKPYMMYDEFGEYQEVIAPSAFDKTLAASPDVAFLVNHKGMTMARTKAGTLELSVDAVGLRSIAFLNPERSDVENLIYAVKDGNIDQMSFAFRIIAGDWNADYTVFTITEVDINRGDVSACNYGANPDTSIAARAKQALDGINHLRGEALRLVAARAAARVAEETPNVKPAPAGPSAATLRARLEMES